MPHVPTAAGPIPRGPAPPPHTTGRTMTHLSRRRLRRILTAAVATTATVLGITVAATTQAGAAVCGTTNVAQGRPATASSQEGGGYSAAAAVDGNTGTRWSSQFSDPQWIR